MWRTSYKGVRKVETRTTRDPSMARILPKESQGGIQCFFPLPTSQHPTTPVHWPNQRESELAWELRQCNLQDQPLVILHRAGGGQDWV